MIKGNLKNSCLAVECWMDGFLDYSRQRARSEGSPDPNMNWQWFVPGDELGDPETRAWDSSVEREAVQPSWVSVALYIFTRHQEGTAGDTDMRNTGPWGRAETTGNCWPLWEKRRLPWWRRGKESACHAGDSSSIPGSGRSPGEGNGNPLQRSYLENPIDRGEWRATVHGVEKSRTWLNN